MVLMKLLFALTLSFLFTIYLTPILRTLALRFKILDIPDGSVKIHKEPTPYLGGLAVYFGFITSLAMTFPFQNKMFLFLIGSTLLLFIGLIDDLVVMSPHQKFFGQMITTFCFLKAGFYLKQSFFSNNFWNIPISFLWVLVVVNAFNLVDVMDGLAVTLASCATISFLVIALYLGNHALVILLSAFLGALIGFLFYNKPNAKMYLGDAGALFIGGFLAIIPFLFDWSKYNYHGYLTPVVILAIPLIEVGTLIIVRLYKGIPFYQGSPDHFSIYLQKKGWSKCKVLLYAMCMSTALSVIAFLFFINKLSLAALFGLSLVFLVIWYSVLLFRKSIA
ncbi:glycosyltransferase family 4 protein [Candidatus Dependentiae bacterium]